MLPGALVALHYALQVLRPRWGFGSDRGGGRTRWIVGGMGLLACGGLAAAIAVALMATQLAAGIALAVVAFVAIGVGVGAAGTSLLALLAARVAPARRAPAATVVWLMMIGGFVVSAFAAGHLLDPYSGARLVAVSAAVSVAAFVVTALAVRGLEGDGSHEAVPSSRPLAFRAAFADVWAEPRSRRFALFVFVSMLAYSAQDLILEPYAGVAFGMTPGETTRLSGVQHGGVLTGMIVVALAALLAKGRRDVSLRAWTIGGCVASAAALAALAFAALAGPQYPFRGVVFALGAANGVYAIAAIGSMMGLAGAGTAGREGTRMGLFGAAQAVAFGLGGFLGTAASDAARHVVASSANAYAIVFAAEAALFLAAGTIAAYAVFPRAAPAATPPLTSLRGGHGRA